jgi:hypothetical protein
MRGGDRHIAVCRTPHKPLAQRESHTPLVTERAVKQLFEAAGGEDGFNRCVHLLLCNGNAVQATMKAGYLKLYSQAQFSP